MKKRVAFSMIIVATALSLGSTCFAESKWYTCSVRNVGPVGTAAYMRLTDISNRESAPEFVDRWFRIPTEWTSEVIAIAIAAKANGIPLLIKVDLQEGTTYPQPQAIYLGEDLSSAPTATPTPTPSPSPSPSPFLSLDPALLLGPAGFR